MQVLPGRGRHIEEGFEARGFREIVWNIMSRIAGFGSAQRRMTALATAETFDTARYFLTHCHPTRHTTPVDTYTHTHTHNKRY